MNETLRHHFHHRNSTTHSRVRPPARVTGALKDSCHDVQVAAGQR